MNTPLLLSRRLILAALLGVAALLTGCGTTATTATTASPPPPTSVAPASATPSPPPVATGPKTCTSNQLGFTLDDRGGLAGAGHLASFATITNSSAQQCTLKGFVNVQLHDAAGHPATTSVHQGGQMIFGGSDGTANSAVALVTLAPGASAHFGIEYEDVQSNSASCTQAAAFFFAAPGDAAFVQATGISGGTAMVCNNGTVYVTPIASTTPSVGH